MLQSDTSPETSNVRLAVDVPSTISLKCTTRGFAGVADAAGNAVTAANKTPPTHTPMMNARRTNTVPPVNTCLARV